MIAMTQPPEAEPRAGSKMWPAGGRLYGEASRIYTEDTLNYWLQLWCDVYSWLLQTRPSSALFVCYEDLCTNPETWRVLTVLANIPDAVDVHSDMLKMSEQPTGRCFDGDLADRAERIYAQLISQAHDGISCL